MEHMNLGETLGTLEDLTKVKEIIDDCFTKTFVDKDWDCGGGRDVLFLDRYVVKFPKEDAPEIFNGTSQNVKELEVYMGTRHRHLVPVYGTHLGCLICKKVDDTPIYTYMSKYNLTEQEAESKLEADISVKMKDLQPIIKYYGLSASDMAKFNSWGYDKDLDDIVCLDYGLSLPGEKAYSKLLQTLDDDTIMKAYELAYEVIESSVRYEEPRLGKRETQEEDMLRIFKVDVIPQIGSKLIMEEAVRRGFAEFRKLSMEEVRKVICKELPNKETLESKAKDYNGYYRTVKLDCFGFEVNIYKYDYKQTIIHLCKELFRYRLLIAFRK